MNSKLGTVILVVVLVLLVALVSWHEGIVSINLHALTDSIWKIARSAIEIIMGAILGRLSK